MFSFFWVFLENLFRKQVEFSTSEQALNFFKKCEIPLFRISGDEETKLLVHIVTDSMPGVYHDDVFAINRASSSLWLGMTPMGGGQWAWITATRARCYFSTHKCTGICWRVLFYTVPVTHEYLWMQINTLILGVTMIW